MWRRWDTSQNFFLTLIDELEKQLFKKLLKGANIKQINFNSYNVAFLKKDKNVWRYYQNLNNMIYISWDIEKTVRQNWKKQILVMLGHFLCPFTPLKTQIIQFWKNEKNCQRYHHFTRVYQKSYSYDVRFQRYGVIQTEFFVILGNFLPFYPPNDPENQNFEKMKKMPGDIILSYIHVYHKLRYDICFLKYKTQQTEFFVILGDFWPFHPSDNPNKSKLCKTEKTSGDIVILYISTINDNHTMHGSWDMERNRQNFLSFWTVVFAILPSMDSVNQNFEKMKKTPGDIIILQQCTKNHDHMLHCSWDTMHDRCNFYFSFWAIFHPLLPPPPPP